MWRRFCLASTCNLKTDVNWMNKVLRKTATRQCAWYCWQHGAACSGLCDPPHSPYQQKMRICSDTSGTPIQKKAYANINRSPCGVEVNLSLMIASSLPQDLRTLCTLLAPLLACLLFIIGTRLVELSRLRGSCSGVLGQLQNPSSLCMLQSLNLQ